MCRVLLSIIIPVYNCAPVITRCLNSIDCLDAEIIVVDDGSTDDSACVVSDYALTHPNVRLLQKENGGVSSARNVGIEAAAGKYIMFVDADDYLASGGIERVLRLAEEKSADVVSFSFRCLSANAPIDKESVATVPMSEEVVKGRFAALKMYDVPDYLVWDAIILRDVIIRNHIRFHNDLHLHEDDVFMGELYCHTETIVVTDLPLYRYIQASNYSSTHKQSVEKQRRLIESSLLAIGYRQNYVGKYCPEALPLERLKFMRWVCQPKTAIAAGYSLSEYKEVLGKFEEYGCWPLDYNWMHTARLDWSWKIRTKNRMKTFLCNHPGLAYWLLKNKYK